jgi:hypothetical protein
MRGGLDNCDFKGGTNGSFQQVSPSNRTIVQTENGVKVQARFPVIPLRDVAFQALDLTLLN